MSSISRRQFLAASGAALGATTLLAACGGGGGDVTAASCEGYDTLTEAQLAQRQALNYVDNSTTPGQRCDNCRFHNVNEGSACMGCQLFPGPVAPQGWCSGWAALT